MDNTYRPIMYKWKIVNTIELMLSSHTTIYNKLYANHMTCKPYQLCQQFIHKQRYYKLDAIITNTKHE